MGVPRATSPTQTVAILVAGLGIAGLATEGLGKRGRAEDTGGRAPPGADAGPERPAAQALREGRPVDLNAMDERDLALLPGIGPALASRIVADREAHGPYPEVDALTRVRGVGPKTVARLRDRVRVEPPRRSDRGDRGKGPALAPPAPVK